MDRETKDQTAKIICFGVGCVIAIWVFLQLLPYLVVFLAICGAWYLFQEHERSKRNNHHNSHRRHHRHWH
jgi:uncharacterized protein involved in cysteine biosynthesis